jgi:P4 family phage/plasmid primase-like protien
MCGESTDMPDAEPTGLPVEDSAFREQLFDPYRLGRLLITRQRGLPTILYHRGEWWKWEGGCYAKVCDKDFEIDAWLIIREWAERLYEVRLRVWESIIDEKKGEAPTLLYPPQAKISAAIKAAASMVHIAGDVDTPVMLRPESDEPDVISLLVPDPDQRSYIALQNGLIDSKELRETGQTTSKPLTPLYFSPCALPVTFDPDANCPKFLSFLEQITNNDHERQMLLQEMTGYLLTIDLVWHAFFFLEGSGGNGKSSFLAVVRALLGSSNISSVALEVFGERFRLTPTLGKLANIVEEVGEMDKTAEGTLKWYTGGGAMDFDRKNKEPVNRIPTARLVFATNTLPRFADRTEGIWRRYFVIPFDVTIPKDKIIRGMDKPEYWVQSGELPGILNWALCGLHRLHKQGWFTTSAVCEEKKQSHRIECHPVKQFLADYVHDSSNGIIAKMELFSAYREWCRDRSLIPLGEPKFAQEIYKEFRKVNSTRPKIGGKRVQCYEGIGWMNGRPSDLLKGFDEKHPLERWSSDAA